MTEEDFNELMKYLEEVGAVVRMSESEDSDNPLYKFNLDILREHVPDMYDLLMEELDNELLELYKKGLVDIEYDENLNAQFSISEKGKIFAETGIMPEDEDDLL